MQRVSLKKKGFRPVDLRFKPMGLRFKTMGLKFRPEGRRSSVFVFGSLFSTHPLLCRYIPAPLVENLQISEAVVACRPTQCQLPCPSRTDLFFLSIVSGIS